MLKPALGDGTSSSRPRSRGAEGARGCQGHPTPLGAPGAAASRPNGAAAPHDALALEGHALGEDAPAIAMAVAAAVAVASGMADADAAAMVMTDSDNGGGRETATDAGGSGHGNR